MVQKLRAHVVPWNLEKLLVEPLLGHDVPVTRQPEDVLPAFIRCISELLENCRLTPNRLCQLPQPYRRPRLHPARKHQSLDLLSAQIPSYSEKPRQVPVPLRQPPPRFSFPFGLLTSSRSDFPATRSGRWERVAGKLRRRRGVARSSACLFGKALSLRGGGRFALERAL